MTSLNISSSYHTNRFEQSLQTFQLMTHSQECSPIEELYSQGSSNMSPQVLFPNQSMHKKCTPQLYRIQRDNQANKQTENQLQSRLETFLQGQIHQSFEIDENQGPFRHITQSNLNQRVLTQSNKENIEISPQHSSNSLIKINFTVSRHLQPSSFPHSSRRCPIGQVDFQLSELKNNFSILKSIVQRFQTQKRYRTLDKRQIPEAQSQYVRNINIDAKKNSQSTQSGNKISKINARSAKSQQVVNGTPIKQQPIVTEFNLPKSSSKSQLDQMSPIISLGDYSQLSYRKLNTSENSSRMLMKRKFNWKGHRLMNTQ